MSLILPLERINEKDGAAAGGKGANLGQLLAAGFPVPPGFVLTTAAYRTFVDHNDLQPRIQAILKDGTPAGGRIQDEFSQGVMPSDVRAALLQAYGALQQDGAAAVAVRSSATAEDLPDASFAGQQETFLNVQGEEALVEAVTNCLAGLWTERAIAYRQRLGIDHEKVQMAVVVQEMVPSDLSGVLFSANPLSGARNEVVINGSFGLGEAIVSGKVTPDTIVVEKDSWRISQQQISAKTVMTVATEEGTAEQEVELRRQTQPALDEATAVDLAKMGIRIEEHFGWPADIEWAVANDSIYILQARPITNLPAAPLEDVQWQPPKPGTIWMRRQIVEHMPGPLSPLFDELYLEQGLDRSLDEMAILISELSGTEINVWDFVDPPFATTINGYAYSIASFNLRPGMFSMAIRIYVKALPKMIRHLVPRWREESLPRYLDEIDAWKGVDLGEAADLQLLRGIRRLAYEDAIYWFASSVPLGMARTSDAILNTFLRGAAKVSDLNGQGVSSGYLLRGFPTMATEAQAHLEQIGREIGRLPDLQETLLRTAPGDWLEVLADHPQGQPLMSYFADYLQRYGHQIYNLDFAEPTLADDPLPVLLSLKSAVANPEQDARQRRQRLAQEREALAQETLRRLNPLLRPLFRRLLNWAQRYAPIREEALFYVGAAWPTLRALALELGRRLTDSGSLPDPAAVFYLRSTELKEAILSSEQGIGRPELAELAQTRRQLRAARQRLDPPSAVPPDGRMKFGPIDMGAFEPKPRAVSSGAVLEGFAVSPGRVSAPASVIRSPADFHKMIPDTILVCPTTTPAWTPLFSQAKGLVTDIGGALAHGSIVAREYGIPAVMGTGQATARIEEGQMITVDGDKGQVILNQEDEEPAEQQPPQRQRPTSKPKFATLIAMAVIAIAGLILWRKKKARR